MHGCLLPCPLVTCLPSAVPVVGSGVSVVSPGSCFDLFVSLVACSACGLVLVLLSRHSWHLFLVGHLCFNHRSQRRAVASVHESFSSDQSDKDHPEVIFSVEEHRKCSAPLLSTQSVACVHRDIAGAEHHCVNAER